MESQINALVTRVILDNTGRQLDLAADESLIQSGYLDSMTMVSLVIALQDQFGLQLELADLSADKFETIRAITHLVRGHLAQ